MEILGNGAYGIIFDIGINKILKAYPIERVFVSSEGDIPANIDDRKLLTKNVVLAEQRSYEKLNELFKEDESLSDLFPEYFDVEKVSDYLDDDVIDLYSFYEYGVVLSKVDYDHCFRWWYLKDDWWNKEKSVQYLKEILSEEERVDLLNKVARVVFHLIGKEVSFGIDDVDILFSRKENIITYKLIDFSVCFGLWGFIEYLSENGSFTTKIRDFLSSGQLTTTKDVEDYKPSKLNSK